MKFIRSCLLDIKKNVAKDNYTFVERRKNIDFIRENFLTLEDVKEIILDLLPNNCVKGPEEDSDGYEGHVLIFKTDYILENTIYIKIRYNPPDEVVCISFHEDQ